MWGLPMLRAIYSKLIPGLITPPNNLQIIQLKEAIIYNRWIIIQLNKQQIYTRWVGFNGPDYPESAHPSRTLISTTCATTLLVLMATNLRPNYQRNNKHVKCLLLTQLDLFDQNLEIWKWMLLCEQSVTLDREDWNAQRLAAAAYSLPEGGNWGPRADAFFQQTSWQNILHDVELWKG